FFGCSSLLSLSISTTTQSVSFASHAFYGCGELASVYVNNLSSVGRGAFLGCENVSSFICSGEVVVHENGGAFGLYMSEPTSATLIGFVGAASSYVVPERVSEYDLPVTVIGEEAFSSLSGLRSIVLNASVSSIEDKAFYNCVSLRSVDFNGNTAVRTIGKSAFAGCVQLRDIVLPSVIQTIGDSAFENCSSLTSFVLPAETTVLGERVFASCRKMREFVFGGRKLVSLPQGTFSSCVLLASVALPQGIETVDEGAFEQCSSLLSVSLPTGLKQIRAYAFSHCKKLTALSLPNSVVNLGEKVFNGCVGLEELQFGTGIASLGMGLLSGCKSLRSLTLPFVGASAAETRTVYPFGYIFGTSSYEGAVRTNQSIIESSTFGGETFYTYTSAAYYLPVSLKTVTVRSGSVNEGAFSGCIYLQTVDISATGVRKIGKKAFSGCSALSNIVFPDTLTTIDAEAFYYCSSLNDIVLPEKVCDESVDETAFVAKSAFTYTGYYANQNNWEEGVLYVKVRKGSDYELFAVDSSTSLERACHVKDGTVLILDNAFENSSFTEVYLPSSLRKIGSSILKGNKKISLLSVPFIGETMTKNTFLAYFFGGVLPATGSDLELSVNSSREYIPSSLSTLVLTGIGSIPDRVCHGCHTLTSVIIGEGYSSVGSYAFSNCSLLENVSVPNSLTSVGMYAFEYCTSLLSIVLPTGLTGVGKGAFSNCTAMKFYSAPFIGATPTGNQYLGFVFCPATENTPTASMNGDLVPESLEVVSISGSYPAVPASAFYGCRFIKTVLLNVKTTTIGSDAFYNCTSLSNVYIVGGTAGSTYNPTYRDEAPRHERFANASWHRIYFDSDTVTRNLSTVMQDNVYINRLNSNDVSLVMESVKYTSSDPDIAAFEYEFDENGNGVIEAIEKKDHSSDGLVTFFRKGVATVTVTIKTPTFIVSLSYTLTIS
ncbi:MAG: leucine-rich repeat protein, partial [Clostridia bacterium]|nr:leucine-rich repeat protein [Clostridia bacterium]